MKAQILDYLSKATIGKTPTEIGIALGKSYNTASASVSAPLKILLQEGLVKKMIIDRRTTYQFVK